jgi:uncharacterized CHY-type Zn-finger protein
LDQNEDLILAKLAVGKGMCTQADIDECLKIQSLSSPSPPLGDLLLFKGYLTEAQLKELAARMTKKAMTCPRCRLTFTVLTTSDGKSARCPKCKEPLGETPPGGHRRTDAEITTQRMRLVPAEQSLSPGNLKKIRLVCVVCDHGFQGSPDATGRVRCPSCQSTFTARG